jgi:hypothetical protein
VGQTAAAQSRARRRAYMAKIMNCRGQRKGDENAPTLFHSPSAIIIFVLGKADYNDLSVSTLIFSEQVSAAATF